MLDHLTYVHHDMLEKKEEINYDVYEHFAYKFNLAVVESDKVDNLLRPGPSLLILYLRDRRVLLHVPVHEKHCLQKA